MKQKRRGGGKSGGGESGGETTSGTGTGGRGGGGEDLFTFGPEDHDNPEKAIRKFLNYTVELMDRVAGASSQVDEQYDVLPEELKQSFRHAWSEFKRNQLEDLRDKLEDIDRQTLKAHGLTDDQLSFKLNSVEWVSENPKDESTSNWLPSLFDSLEPTLDSIISALGGETALNELKELVRSLLPF